MKKSDGGQTVSPMAVFSVPSSADYPALLGMVYDSFNTFDAPDYTENGRRSFMGYAELESFTKRQRRSHISFLLSVNGEPAGMIEVREVRHISMLFVSPPHIGTGCGRALIEHALCYIRRRRRLLRHITVNASPFAYGFYRHMGFTDSGPTENSDGMIYTPMRLRI